MAAPASPLLKRTRPPKALISLVPMIDVMLILLVFFMVTSTYINLDMIPALQRTEGNAPATETTEATQSPVLMVRIGADGQVAVRGQNLGPVELERLFAERFKVDPDQRLLILPSGAANMQALVSVMDSATASGLTRVQVIRLESSP
ncbi:MAG: biopolymer transporter ExbD [Sulfitobacter sp.]|nr:biopolymer transporter ExbD [Sulfitobacter sp.]